MWKWATGALVLGLLLPAWGLPQSMGSVARKETERRKKNHEKGVEAPRFDTESLGPAHEPGADEQETGPASDDAAASSSPADQAPHPVHAAASAADRPAQEDEERAREESTWRERAAKARARLETAQRRYDKVKGLVLAPGEYFVDSNGKVVVGSPEELQSIVAQARTELEEAQAALDELEEAARREGALPGWLRAD